MVIEKIQSPPNTLALSNGDQMFLVARKRGHVTCFWKTFNKGFPKRCHNLAFYGN